MILLDTDVVFDVALGRDPHVEAPAALLDQIERGSRSAFVAWHTLPNLDYLVRPALGDVDTRTFLLERTRFVTVAPTDSEAFRFATSLEMSDLEDAMQVAAARSCGVGTIVTRNVRDFRRAPIEVRTPDEVLEGLQALGPRPPSSRLGAPPPSYRPATPGSRDRPPRTASQSSTKCGSGLAAGFKPVPDQVRVQDA